MPYDATAHNTGSTPDFIPLSSRPMLPQFTISLLLVLANFATAVEIRVVTYNIGAHLQFPVGLPAYFDYGIGPPGQPDHDTVRAVLARLNADVVTLQEVHSADFTSGDLTTLATSLGYPFISYAPATQAFDASLHVAILSRFPFLSQALITPAAGFKDMTRLIPAVKIDVPGTTRDPVVITAHLKVGTGASDVFQRAVEMHRLTQYVNSSGLTANDNYIILGDFNLNPTAYDRTFNALPTSGLPSTFSLGPDVPLPIRYFTAAPSYFTSPTVTRILPRQLNQSLITRPSATAIHEGTSIDLLLVSPIIASRPLRSEIYNSALDLSNESGLPKAGLPLATTTSAAASDHYALFADVELDSAVPYTFTAIGQTLTETFDGFPGTYDPYPWVTTGGAWKGIDTGTAAVAGFRAYGSATEAALGFIPSATGGTATASFLNQSGKNLDALEISFTTEQWRSVNGGTRDSLTVELIIRGTATPVPALTVPITNSLASGAIAGGAASPRNTRVTGLTVTPGEEFQLRFNFTPGAGAGTAPGDLFINEFHYDNAGTDQGELIEIVAGPGFLGDFSEIDVVLYNGSNGRAYRTLNLASAEFTRTTTPHHFTHFVASDGVSLQNGPDGIAIVNKVTQQVIQFISYDGSFTATDGIAAAMASTDIGVSETGAEAVGAAALGLTGSGGVRTDFTWEKIVGPTSPGVTNSGQTLINPVPPPQGFAIDQLAVKSLAGGDADGDGSPDAAEQVFGTDPLDSASRFSVRLTRPAANQVRLEFLTSVGRSYAIESSDDLFSWVVAGTEAGDGMPRTAEFPVTGADGKRFYRVRVTLE